MAKLIFGSRQKFCWKFFFIPIFIPILTQIPTKKIMATNETLSMDHNDQPICNERCQIWISAVIATLCLAALLTNCYVLLSTFWLRQRPSVNLILCISLAAADTWASFLNLLLLLAFISSFAGFDWHRCFHLLQKLKNKLNYYYFNWHWH